MPQTHRSLPRDVFIHLLMIATLYAAVGAFIALIFQYVNALFPDALTTYYPSLRDSIRRSEAILFVVFPCYLALSWLIERDLAKNPDMRDFKVRKWLIYFTLFISAITIITDLIVLIYNFLGGELTVSFVLKILAVLLTACAVFGYYLWDLRRGTGTRSYVPRLAASASGFIVIAALIGGFFIVGSPATERSRRFDAERIQHLQTIQNEVVNHWVRKQKVPESLDALKDDISGFTAPRDPETRAAYEYRTTTKLSFELCAVFATDSTESEKGAYPMAAPMYREPYYPGMPGDNWRHGTGRACFARTIDPELYKPEKPLPR